MRPFLRQTAHRPWPLPQSPWILAQTWEQLLFLHWPVEATALAERLPQGLELDTFDGEAWLGVVPFRMAWVRPRGLPPVPPLSFFPELNVRTYVTRDGMPGVWFFSLEASSRVAVRIARRFFHLPYFDADMSIDADGAQVRYTSQRTHRGAPPAEFRGSYAPSGPVDLTKPGTLEHWLTERYCLYAADEQDVLYRAHIHHEPWPLQPAEATLALNTMAMSHGLALPHREPLCHFARSIDVVAWLPRAVD
ncbi:MAG: DUF2071 domain-containing protein [Planctomycetota bacterium]|nr:DUF2071 domain-containing protein [Planctomycetota bacterium]